MRTSPITCSKPGYFIRLCEISTIISSALQLVQNVILNTGHVASESQKKDSPTQERDSSKNQI